MSIQTEITRLQNAKASIKTAIEGKGVQVASTDKLDDYANLITQIPTAEAGQPQLVKSTSEISLTANNVGKIFVDEENRYMTVVPKRNEAWTDGFTKPIGTMAYGKGKYVVVGSDSASYSTDGTNWTAITNLPVGANRRICFGGDRFIVVGKAGYSYYSTDGINWTQMQGIDSSYNTNFEITYDNGVFYAAGCYENYLRPYKSTDGTSWQAMWRLIDSGLTKIDRLIVGNGILLVIANGGARLYKHTINDGTSDFYKITTWSSSSVIAYSFAFGNDIWIWEGGNATGYYYSTDNFATISSFIKFDSSLSTNNNYMFSNVKYVDGTFYGIGGWYSATTRGVESTKTYSTSRFSTDFGINTYYGMINNKDTNKLIAWASTSQTKVLSLNGTYELKMLDMSYLK